MASPTKTCLSFETLDSDGDGLISRAEYFSAFDVLDGDKDGLISEAEFRCVCCCAPFAVLDSDGDGMLSRKEYEGGFDVFDMDGDGFASKAELNQPLYKLVAKWNGKKIELRIGHMGTVGQVRLLLESHTHVPQKRQKLIGLGKKANPDDCVVLGELQLKDNHSFMMIGAPNEAMMCLKSEIPDMPDICCDLDPDYDSNERQFADSTENKENLKKTIAKTEINLMREPREGKRLLVLDLDHTLLHYKDPQTHPRPHCIEFLRAMYPHYDLCVWSQTKWPYIQAKLQDLGVVGLGGEAIPDINILFILDKNAMFKIRSNRMVDGRPYHHEVRSTDTPTNFASLGTGIVDDFI